MLSPSAFTAPSLNGPVGQQCRYSGCTLPRHMRPNGARLRFCNQHRIRQNVHQRAFMQRHRREDRQRVRRARISPIGDPFAQIELDDVLDELDAMDFERLVDEMQLFLNDPTATFEPASTLDELWTVPINSIDDVLAHLSAPDR